MRRIGSIIALCLLATAAASQTFSDFVIRVNMAPETARGALVDSFLAAQPSLPLIEKDTIVHFITRATGASVALAGDMNGWTPASGPLQRLSNTALWYRTATHEADARLDYKYVVDGVWLLDARNPRTCSGGFGPNSELRMPRCPEQPELVRAPGVPRGTMRDTSLSGAGLGTRAVRVYLPAGYDTLTAACPVVLFHDGLDYLTLAGVDAILDNLIAQRRIPPVIAVFVPASERASEYSGAKMSAYGAWIANTVMGWVDARYRTRRDAAGRAVMGASDGGNISLYCGVTFPAVFGNVGAQSSNVVGSISSAVQNGPKLPLRVYLDLGTYDIGVLLPRVRGLVSLLQARGYDHAFREYHEGHSWGNWRARIDDALIYFFGSPLPAREAPAAEPSGLFLDPSYPSPARDVTTIPFRTGHDATLLLRILDSAGRVVAQLASGAYPPGTHLVRWDTTGVPRGAYVCTLDGTNGIARRSILVF